MKNKTILLVGSFLFLWCIAPTANAQMMGTWDWKDTVTQQEIDQVNAEEAQGKAIYDQLQNKTLGCNTLTDAQFELLGEYFMGLMHGDNHALVNKHLDAIYGAGTAEASHLDLGKLQSGCGGQVLTTRPCAPTNAGAGSFWMPMMNWSTQGGTSPTVSTYWTPTMMIMMVLNVIWWVALIVGVIIMIRWIVKSRGNANARLSVQEILSERYAKGELTKAEFEKMKKELEK